MDHKEHTCADEVEQAEERDIVTHLAQAMLTVSQRVPSADKSVQDRLNRAYDIVRALGEGYTITAVTNGVYKVHKASTAPAFSSADSSRDYVTDNRSCSCPDFEKARAGLCKHRLAVMLLEEMRNAE